MSIHHHDEWDISEKGKKDAERHHEKIDDAIRKNVRDVIAEETIITKRKGRKVRVPVRGMKDYKFVHGNNEGAQGGVGQGEGEAGDVIDRKGKPQQGQEPGEPGKDDKGHDYIEAEVDIDYLIKIMFEDLGLPWIEEKEKAQVVIPKGWKFETISKKGIQPRLHKKRTMLEAVKRMVAYAYEIMDETGCDEDTANRALRQAQGDINDAILIIQENRLEESDTSIMFEDDDMRYKTIEPDTEIQSRAVIICMMDVSGSMDTNKKYLARSMLFWLTEFLKQMYDNVEIRFITHTTEAQLVDEDTFFNKGESGGTRCASAFEFANHLIDTEYPVDRWNVYCVYISDGEDFSPSDTISEISVMLNKDVNMLSYVEIKIDSGWGTYAVLMDAIRKQWKFHETATAGTKFYKNTEKRFLLSIIKNRDHVFPALKHMLFEKKK